MKKIFIWLFIIGVLLIFYSISVNITGGVIGISDGNLKNLGIFIFGLSFIFVSIIFYVHSRSLEAIIVPTGNSSKADKQRAKGGAIQYNKHRQLTNHHDVVVISGKYDGGRFFGSQSDKIYRTLRKNGVPRKDIILEDDSSNTIENVLYTCEELEKKDIHEVTVVTDKLHAARFRMLFKRAKSRGYAPEDLKVHTFSEGIQSSYGFVKAAVAYIKDMIKPLKKA